MGLCPYAIWVLCIEEILLLGPSFTDRIAGYCMILGGYGRWSPKSQSQCDFRGESLKIPIGIEGGREAALNASRSQRSFDLAIGISGHKQNFQSAL